MLSYQGDAGLKARFVGHVARHRAEDRVLQGTYGQTDAGEWRGCAVACSLRSLDEIDGRPLSVDNRSHANLAARLGIPLVLTRLEDAVFEGLSVELAREWPLRFAEAIPVGRSLEMVWPRLALWMLSDADSGMLRLARTDRTRKAIGGVVELYQSWVDTGVSPDVSEWRNARAAAAYAAAAAAADAAADAADAAAYAADADAADAADAAADAADAADAAAYAAAANAAADAAAAAARKVHWSKIADKLIELMGAA